VPRLARTAGEKTDRSGESCCGTEDRAVDRESVSSPSGSELAMTKIPAVLIAVASLAAISGCGASAGSLRDHAASHVVAAASARDNRAGHCLKVTVYSYSPAEQKAALGYWTHSRMKSATGFSAASLPSALTQLRHPQGTSASALSVCLDRRVPRTAAPAAP
jgi:hypothetical protein